MIGFKEGTFYWLNHNNSIFPLFLSCPALFICLFGMGVDEKVQNTGEPMPNFFFLGLGLVFLQAIFFIGQSNLYSSWCLFCPDSSVGINKLEL